jgi:hypothetical protein
VQLSPTRRIARLLVVVRPVLGNGVITFRPTEAQRTAVHELDSTFIRRCGDANSTGHVFKIVIEFHRSQLPIDARRRARDRASERVVTR